MVKHLRLLMLSLLVMICAAVGAQVVTFPTGLPSDWEKTGTGKAIAANYQKVACLQLQQNAEVTSPAISGKVSQIVINLSRSSKGTNFTVSYKLGDADAVLIKEFTKNDVASGVWAVQTIDVPAEAQVDGCKFVFAAVASSYYMSQVEFVSASAPVKAETTTFGDGIDEATFIYKGDELPVSRTATVSPEDAINNGTISYESDNTDVASVDATTGALTFGSAYGTAKITATYTPADDALFKESSAFYYVKHKRAADPKTVVFDATDDDAFASIKDNQGYQDGDYKFVDLNGDEYSFNLHNVMFNFYGHGLQLKKLNATDETAQGVLTSPTFDKFEYGYRVTVKYEAGHGVELTCPNYPDETFSVDNVDNTVYMEIPYADGVFKILGGSQVSYVTSIELTPLDKPAEPTVMSFPESEYNVYIGDDFTAPKATITNELGAAIEGLPVIYTSDNENVALVDENNGTVVLGEEAGTATIKAYFIGNADYEASQASYTINLSAKPEKQEPGFYYEETAVQTPLTAGTLTASQLWFRNPNGLALTFTSSDENVAEIDAEGTVTLKSVGTTVLKATYAGDDTYKAGESSMTLTVSDNRNEANISFNESEYTANMAISEWFRDKVVAENPYNLDLVYTSSNHDVAVESEEIPNCFKLVGTGETIITATFAGNNYFKPASASYKLTVVNNPVDAIGRITADSLSDNDHVYNLQGQRVGAKQLKKGVYVVNGKKVVIGK